MQNYRMLPRRSFWYHLTLSCSCFLALFFLSFLLFFLFWPVFIFLYFVFQLTLCISFSFPAAPCLQTLFFITAYLHCYFDLSEEKGQKIIQQRFTVAIYIFLYSCSTKAHKETDKLTQIKRKLNKTINVDSTTHTDLR